MMSVVKEWLVTLNEDTVWRTSVENACTWNELEEIVDPVVSEIGWLNLQGLGDIIASHCQK